MKHISASQIKTFRDCQRKWYLERTEAATRTVGAGAALGKHLHSVIEKTLLSGDVANLVGETTLDGLVWLRELVADHGPVPAADVEREIWLGEFAVPVIGFIDLVLPGADNITIVDHKTTSAWRYMLTAEQLRGDPQAIIYTYAMALAYPDAASFTFTHHYILTKGKPQPERMVSVTFTRDEVLAHADTLRQQIAEMAATFEIGVANAVPGAYGDACWRYGGCAFKSRCYGERQPAADAGGFDMSSLFGGGSGAAPAAAFRVVYKDCLPTGAQPTAWAAFVEPVVKEYCERAEVPSHLTVPYEKGVRQVAEAVRLAVVNGKLAWPAAGVYCNSADPTANLFCALAGDAFQVVMPVR